ncbi:serine/threonine-protein kinase TOUSLED-like isoform X1 [Papaver somniferum]|uniref:serine/threonine-protein kinase TOUSLED-like isoform X1 n=1 Tax=Papaver somniferum TaxID=3469 RepID=UPI000E6FFC0A|nr:serine/threonine-protein kinase TOUSLED-like isoform X1 [Papaver somniferum]
MSDDLFLQFSSNSSNQSDPSLPTKLAKLEARMAGKGATPVQASWSSVNKFGAAEELAMPEQSYSSDSEEDTAAQFLIQPNPQKRLKLQEDAQSISFQQSQEKQVPAEERIKTVDTGDAKFGSEDTVRKRQGRGRGRSSTGRGRGSKANDQVRPQASPSTSPPSNGQPENALHKESRPKEVHGKDEKAFIEEENVSLRAEVALLKEELRKMRQERSDGQQESSQLKKELKDIKDQEQQTKPKRIKVVSELLISVSKAERQEARMKVRQDSLRFGNVGVLRAGTIISETWEDGQALKDLNTHLKHLLEMKESIERHRKSLKKRQSDKGDGNDAETGMPEEEFLVQDEICKTRLASIKREEEVSLRERDRCELEKGRLIREMKRIRDEDGSRFNNFQILNHRYALLNLLGKGGFSEVYKAFDLVEYRYVACKLHGLNAQWSEEKKQSYIRHAIREYNIHKTLVHHHIVRLWDIFEIDHNTFCTVLEYCSGKDLDAVLKGTPVLPEREAKIVVVQIFQGLVYLNKRPQKIIHYDLKPGNVLFDELGVAKVTDFGLSKIVEDDVGSQGMELTSQGAGTYWYLPPECFELSRTPLISSKVDVWSAGVLFYQMLFGKRPFGHDQTQERILREDTIIRARKVEFPSRPTVSSEAKDLIRRCLTYNQADRPDVLTIAQDPYLSYTKKRSNDTRDLT